MNGKNVILKTDYDYNWKKCEKKYIPKENTIILYKYCDGSSKVKFSDGIHYLYELPFLQQDTPSMSVDDGVLNFNK